MRAPCVVVAAVAAWLFAAGSWGQGVGPHWGVGHLAGTDAGLDDGYTSFGGFVPLAKGGDDALCFFDGAFLLYNEGSDYLGANLGLGGRRYSDLTGSLLGGYVYYDHRGFEAFDFQQVGCGVESLGETWDARLNLNVPVGGADQTVAGGTGLINGVPVNLATTYHALTVLDAETGAKVYEVGSLQLRTFAGVYGLFDDAIDAAAGVRGRVEARLCDRLWVGGFVAHDGQFDTTGGLTCEFRWGRGPCTPPSSECLLARLGDPVQRRRYVAVAQTDASTIIPDTVDNGSAEDPPVVVPPAVDPPVVDPPAEDPPVVDPPVVDPPVVDPPVVDPPVVDPPVVDPPVVDPPVDGGGGPETPPAPAGLPGDFNGDRTVDAADYLLWRELQGQPDDGLLLSGNGDGGVIGESDYLLWLNNYGASLP